MEEKNIIVSIICTAYNHEKHIRSALDGFVMQKTNFAFEALVHDDASTDATADIIREYAEKYPDIIKPIIQTENQYSKKVLITNDIILPMARGKYLAFCEGDDFWTDANKLQLQIDFMEKNPEYVACAHNTTFHYCNEDKADEMMVLRDDEHDIEFEDVIWGLRNAYQTSALVVRKEKFFNMPDFYFTASKYGFGDFPRAIWYTLIGKVRFFPYNMSTYRFMSSPTSWSTSGYTASKLLRQREGIIAMLEDVKKHVNDERKKLLDKAILEQQFYSLDLQGKYKEMRGPRFLQLWKTTSFSYRLKIRIKQLCPWLYKKMRKIGD